jgi:hypothetical protein
MDECETQETLPRAPGYYGSALLAAEVIRKGPKLRLLVNLEERLCRTSYQHDAALK